MPHKSRDSNLTLDFLLLNWKIPRRPFFSCLPKLVVLERRESRKIKSGGGEEEELDMIVSAPHIKEVRVTLTQQIMGNLLVSVTNRLWEIASRSE